MATFFVGQRVRKARGIDAGNTGTIVGFVGFWGDKGPFERLKDWDWRQGCDVDVCWDKAGLCTSGYRHAAGECIHCHTDDLEPLIPDGMQPVVWSECLWQPEGVAA
ncbi:hypothetical protein [Lysobacter capsici]|uniref:hypothetical protein n=1 Tax=Lysobacter capsici TaxID=435897 RepID=UPI00287BB3B4|nr:hypothetical protein [Lysobacter capsici]WND79412.1 hypothetical protein RJ610_19225 [Lysobacter capsici]WND84608.1 hypothetical protein RJ609_19240 [Lysobacter capsici]